MDAELGAPWTVTVSEAELGKLDAQRVARFLERVRREVDEGLLPAAQVAIARNRRVVLYESFGAARPDSLFCIFSATKAVTSAAAWLLIQEGALDTAEPVAGIIPEFASNGKDVVTVEQLFTHTAGFPHAPFRPLDWTESGTRLGRFGPSRGTSGERWERICCTVHRSPWRGCMVWSTTRWASAHGPGGPSCSGSFGGIWSSSSP